MKQNMRDSIYIDDSYAQLKSIQMIFLCTQSYRNAHLEKWLQIRWTFQIRKISRRRKEVCRRCQCYKEYSYIIKIHSR